MRDIWKREDACLALMTQPTYFGALDFNEQTVQFNFLDDTVYVIAFNKILNSHHWGVILAEVPRAHRKLYLVSFQVNSKETNGQKTTTTAPIV